MPPTLTRAQRLAFLRFAADKEHGTLFRMVMDDVLLLGATDGARLALLTWQRQENSPPTQPLYAVAPPIAAMRNHADWWSAFTAGRPEPKRAPLPTWLTPQRLSTLLFVAQPPVYYTPEPNVHTFLRVCHKLLCSEGSRTFWANRGVACTPSGFYCELPDQFRGHFQPKPRAGELTFPAAFNIAFLRDAWALLPNAALRLGKSARFAYLYGNDVTAILAPFNDINNANSQSA